MNLQLREAICLKDKQMTDKIRYCEFECSKCKTKSYQYEFEGHWKCSECHYFHPDYDKCKLGEFNCFSCKKCALYYRVDHGWKCCHCFRFYPDLLGTPLRKFIGFVLFVLWLYSIYNLFG